MAPSVTIAAIRPEATINHKEHKENSVKRCDSVVKKNSQSTNKTLLP